MTEAALFYEEQCPGLGTNYLDDIQRSIDRGNLFIGGRGVVIDKYCLGGVRGQVARSIC